MPSSSESFTHLFGAVASVASDATAWRVIDGIAERDLFDALRRARALARHRATEDESARFSTPLPQDGDDMDRLIAIPLMRRLAGMLTVAALLAPAAASATPRIAATHLGVRPVHAFVVEAHPNFRLRAEDGDRVATDGTTWETGSSGINVFPILVVVLIVGAVTWYFRVRSRT